MDIKSSKKVKPFLKWAGGKGQLLDKIKSYYPFEKNKTKKYAEPFVGGGAVLFDILNKYDLDEIYISDINKELINTYIVIRDNIDELIKILSNMQETFLSLDTDKKKEFYIKKRQLFNELKINGNKNTNIKKASLMIFLNKTCFNGLFRVNKSGLFNVPMGNYKKPVICDENNLRAISKKLKKVTIICGNYKQSSDFIDENTFVYFDPPYRPINETSSFTSYTESKFDDSDQLELANFINEMNKKGATILVSNSDPKNTNKDDNFFDNVYSNYNIKRVDASRMINSNGKSRGKIKELIISNL
ncbi:DNA adenine methylase [Caviibacter abscessus]|uniref:DNA adenine methylase n=1 Tax=Caviibacter abscessus TaxID=1766719 RepID=UPI00082FA833|nr:DNA adenine methylase [Caviibacter abscessus]